MMSSVERKPLRDWALLASGLLVAALAIWFGPSLAVASGVESPIGLTALVYAAIFVPMALVALGFGFAGGVRPAIGARPGFWLAIGLASGLFGLAIAAGYARLAGSAIDGAGAAVALGALFAGLGIVFMQVACEEVFFRGWIQPLLARLSAPFVAIGATAVLFALFHILGGSRAPMTLLNLLIGGLWFGLLAWRSGGIVAPIAAHFGWNASEQMLFGLDPNPGIGDYGSILDWDMAGPPIWGGSEEGLNASIAMTFVLAALIVPLVWRKVSESVEPAPHRPGRAPA